VFASEWLFTWIEMDGFILFASIQLHRFKDADLWEKDKNHLLYHAKERQGNIQKKYITSFQKSKLPLILKI